MNDPASPPASIPPGNPVLFAPQGQRPGDPAEHNWFPWTIAAVAIVVVVALLIFLSSSRSSTAPASVHPYAAKLTIGNVQLSQATNFAGDQLTYVDGTVTNHGNRTVTTITVRVLFANDDSEPPQTEQVPLNLIRTRQPYVDTEPVSAAPLKPGSSQDFRLIFDDVSPLWNQQIPTIKIQSLTTHP